MYEIDSGEYFVGDIQIISVRSPAEAIDALREDVGDEDDEDLF